MTKVLFILSAVVMVVATFFAYQNGRAFSSVRDEKAQNHRTIKKELGGLNSAVAEVGKFNGDISRVQGEVDVEAEKLKAQKLKFSQADSESKRVQGDLDSKNKKLEELKAELAKLPEGVKPETLVEDLNKIKQNIAEVQAQAEAKRKEVETEGKKVAEAQKVLDDIVRKIEDRKKAFERNSMTATIVAVNNDWGFVVIDAGQKEGITPDTKLLVTRGTQTVGKLSILAVEGGRTVANIIPDSIVQGLSVAPGDRVILENLFQ